MEFVVRRRYGSAEDRVYIMSNGANPGIEYVATSPVELPDVVTSEPKSIHSSVFLPDPTVLLFPYLLSAVSAVYYSGAEERHEQGDEMNFLVLGVGGGSAMRFLNAAFPKFNTLGVELSKTMVGVAAQYHQAGAKPLSIEHADALTFVHTQPDARYDYILVDCFPFQNNDVDERFRSLEYLVELRRILTPNGIVALNFFESVPDSLPWKQAGFESKVRITSPVEWREGNEVVLLSCDPQMQASKFPPPFQPNNPASSRVHTYLGNLSYFD